MRWTEMETRVRFYECDPMQVVHHSVYFGWFEMGRIELAREAGLNLENMGGHKIYIPVVSAYCEYKESARFDDIVVIRTQLVPPKIAKFDFNYQILRKRGHQLLATGKTSHVLLKEEGGILMRIPPDSQKIIDDFLNER